ncbi:MAG: hypothetical protein A2566_02535 [Candidatus Zambryskibacteria bacterium RIFOXYD1_FULL_40_13]|nr:MAG: hypothetical protein UT25_C0001G0246 [Parcubacteria group bacterium GW2011_GWC1_39_12]KKR18608.1 MAG: hypothetical protein UT49_C0006G0017 [Parcubacteria group bacterium GW2011_GWF1_39_37]KKR34806.1 MAG: hypothetical protein UT68_C0008G0019 [Parcubacteria group bacterium GW2011_GWC2_40_10]KKR52738.1 MAG: hypothetical protein UT89_C0001G0246 [Parcubacteria group bacterium GW2011_GWE1_40_20]KKR69082.1 MAG: hypothetical protein UU11_C0003G0076 [Parcubacteria group bacterium GW2011_GWF2_40_
MSDPKNQHTIPQCYLKQFVDPKVPSNFGPCVWIFERKSKRGKRKNVRSVLTETDVYTLQGDYSIEKSLAQLESEYAVIFENKIKNKLPLTPYEHTIFCAFVAAMLQRTLKQKEHIENQMDQMIGWAKQLEMVHGAKPKSSIAWEEAKKDAHKISVVEMVPDIAKILSKMNVAFLCTKSKRVSFITSDSPAYLFNSQLQFQRWFAPAFGQKHVEIRMPLSPEISVCFSWINNLRGYLVATEDMVHNDNRMVFGYSHQYFIANSQKLKRRWFRRLPLDPVFIWRFLKNKTPMWIADIRRKYRKHHV